ncbi:hypothetical protein NDU88_007915 [Pleurodeles waltl]|uniref:Uncharacterized protein n=1 Tax=Pleurodeles waltl TaxID=8319 RepID=A0AAV7U146_PLEWA|nr:hypothetical protein NDU88_007915 [Pleurodeles waltl]
MAARAAGAEARLRFLSFGSSLLPLPLTRSWPGRAAGGSAGGPEPVLARREPRKEELRGPGQEGEEEEPPGGAGAEPPLCRQVEHRSGMDYVSPQFGVD